MSWLTRSGRPHAFIRWFGSWYYLAHRVRDLERRVVELERQLQK